MRTITRLFGAACLWLASGSLAVYASAPSPVADGTNIIKLAEQAPVHWVSVAQIESSLVERPPMAVGFDIDDTVLFSSPGFWRGKKTWSPESDDYLHNPAFWEKMNNGWDAFSIPKEVARQLIAMHVKRGDSIFFYYRPQPDKNGNRDENVAGGFSDPGSEYESGDFCRRPARAEHQNSVAEGEADPHFLRRLGQRYRRRACERSPANPHSARREFHL